MSWRAEFWQQLLQLGRGFIHGIRAILGTWPGLLTIALLFITLTLGLLLFSRPSNDVAAKASTSLAQIATRVPTRRAIVVATATRRPPMPTLTPTRVPTSTPTATQVGASPLLTESAVVSQVVPLPSEHTGPHLDPTGGITKSQSITESSPITLTPAVSATATPDVLLLLIPTPTPTLAPTATPSIIEALEKPIPSGEWRALLQARLPARPHQKQQSKPPLKQPSQNYPP